MIAVAQMCDGDGVGADIELRRYSVAAAQQCLTGAQE